MMYEFTAAAGTDVGKKRQLNEDAYLLLQDVPLFVVADGMGGHACGEVAAGIAVLTLKELLVPVFQKISAGEQLPDVTGVKETVRKALEEANRRIYMEGIENPERRGLGTTCSLLAMVGDRYIIGHAGDSRVYCLRDGKLIQLTEDHSLVWELWKQGVISYDELEKHPRKNVITRALGISESVDVDLYEGKLETGDRFLLCSDGLSGELPAERLEKILTWTVEPREAVTSLIENALQAGGRDNITAIIIDVHEYKNREKRRSLIPSILLIYTIFLVAFLLSIIH